MKNPLMYPNSLSLGKNSKWAALSIPPPLGEVARRDGEGCLPLWGRCPGWAERAGSVWRSVPDSTIHPLRRCAPAPPAGELNRQAVRMPKYLPYRKESSKECRSIFPPPLAEAGKQKQRRFLHRCFCQARRPFSFVYSNIISPSPRSSSSSSSGSSSLSSPK